MARFFRKTAADPKTKGYKSGAVLSFNHDGLEVARVRRNGRWLPVWHLIFFVYLALLIRLVAMAEAGPAAYANRMASLENGTFIERTAARVMHMDPVSRALAIRIRSGLKKISGA